ncbi:MAG: aminotransferase class I/II-fold pyridoxal phosphate-dependent enzyme [Eggerthellaceae bacterium]|nr:aminotransferase class I/II-fold pyridoxal phosphate-dependent enzyme [Eggerthellaceae bacterium]
MASLFNKQTNLRETSATLPGKPIAMPYDMRSEVTWIDFSNRANPLGAPKPFIQEIHTAFVDGEHNFVPDRDGRAFRIAAARFLGISADNVLVGTSPTQLITYASCAFDYCTVGASVPCPMAYETAIENAGHRFLPLVNRVSFASAGAYEAHKQGNFSGVVLGNPTYPASRLLPRQTLIHYLETCDWVIVDESNIELTIGGESMVSLVDRYPNLIVVRNASTTFGIPGIPISYLVAHEDMIGHIEQFYAGTEIGMFGEVLAPMVSQQTGYLEETHDFLDNEIPWMQCMLSLVPGVNIFPAEGNFVLCEFAPSDELRLGVRNARDLVSSLQLTGFHVDDLDDTIGLPHGNFFCVAVRMREENERLLEAMRKIVRGND